MKQTKSQIMAGTDAVKSKIIANNTVEWYDDKGRRYIRLHNTDIIIQDGNKISFYTDGWKTPTTKARINDLSPVHVTQENSAWRLKYNSQTSLFYEGITINTKTGKIIKPRQDDQTTKNLTKQINDYCKKIKNLPSIPYPEAGDCWDCLLFDNNIGPGDKSTSTDHLISHLKEGYIHGSIICNALVSSGYNNPDFIMSIDSRDNIVRAVRRFFKLSLGIAR